MLELSNSNDILNVWPNLELFIHGAVSFKPYRGLFESLIPSKGMKYLETYNASEGFFAFQDQKNSDEMLLLINHGVYYELQETRSNSDKIVSLLHKTIQKKKKANGKWYITPD